MARRCKVTSSNETEFVEELNDFYLTQVNTLPTRGEHILDLVISNAPEQIVNMSTLNSIDSGLFTDHHAVEFNLKISIKAAPALNRTVFDYRKANMDGLRTALDRANLSDYIESDDINECWIKWKAKFQSVVKNYIPMKRIKERNFPPWMDGNIMHELRKKDSVRKKLKSSPTDSLHNRFKQLRANLKKLMRESRSN